MRQHHALLAFGTFLVTLCLVASSASAQTVVGLQIQYEGEVEPTVQADLEDELADIFDSSRLYDWLPPEQGIERLAPELQGCFDAPCLLDVSDELGARIGLRIQFHEDSHIYDWTVDFFDLLNGDALVTEEGTCELCGRAELIEQFRASIVSNLVTLDVTDERPHEPIDTKAPKDAKGTRVQITAIPDDTRIFIDDEPVGEGEAIVDLAEGRYEVRLSHDTHHGTRETLVITDESAPRLVLRIHLQMADGEPMEAMPRPEGAFDRMGSRRRVIAWSAIGAGAALGATSGVLARRHGQPNCGDDVALRNCPDVYNTATLATTTSIVAGLSLATGVILLAGPRLSGDQQEPIEAGIDVTPEVSRQFSGITLRGRF